MKLQDQSDFRAVLSCLGLAFLFSALLTLPNASPADASVNTYTVTGTSDGAGSCSGSTPNFNCTTLRAAVTAANGNPGSVVVLANFTTYTLTIAKTGFDDNASGDLNIQPNMTLARDPSCPGLCFDATIQGGPGWNDDVINVGAGFTVQINHIAITMGNSIANAGGIYNAGNLTLNGGSVYSNTADVGGGIYNGINGVLNINLASVISNTAATTTYGGAGIFSAGSLNITSSTIQFNSSSRDGGGICVGGALTLTNTSVTTNTASGAGGGVLAYGSVSITNGSIDGNQAGSHQGGGINVSGSGPVSINGTDISANRSSQDGGGIYAAGTNLAMALTNVSVNSNQTDTSYGGGTAFSGGGSLTINGGTFNSNKAGGGFGGGLNVNGPTFNMIGSTVSRNDASLRGGGLYLNTPNAAIAASLFSDNTMTGTNAFGGGIYIFTGTVSISSSTFYRNILSGSSAQGGGIFADGGFTTLDSSTVYSNTSDTAAGIVAGSAMTITNSTISGNLATNGPGGGIEIALQPLPVTIANSTIAYNQANQNGGGIFAPAPPTIWNSIIAKNGGRPGPDCWSAVTSQGYNLLGNNGGCTGMTDGVGGDKVGSPASPLDPKLAPLGYYGGSTKTHALLPTSPAIDSGNPGTPDGSGTHCLPTDQRGVSRPQDIACDMGAFEGWLRTLYLPLILR